MNAQIEFNNFIVGKPDVICAYVQDIGWYYDDEAQPARIELPLGYTDEQYAEFMRKLDFTYDDGYGSQQLDRGEYDGSEWWQHQTRPNVPSYLYPPELPQHTEEDI
jgi:hypothetical protein